MGAWVTGLSREVVVIFLLLSYAFGSQHHLNRRHIRLTSSLGYTLYDFPHNLKTRGRQTRDSSESVGSRSQNEHSAYESSRSESEKSRSTGEISRSKIVNERKNSLPATTTEDSKPTNVNFPTSSVKSRSLKVDLRFTRKTSQTSKPKTNCCRTLCPTRRKLSNKLPISCKHHSLLNTNKSRSRRSLRNINEDYQYVSAPKIIRSIPLYNYNYMYRQVKSETDDILDSIGGDLARIQNEIARSEEKMKPPLVETSPSLLLPKPPTMVKKTLPSPVISTDELIRNLNNINSVDGRSLVDSILLKHIDNKDNKKTEKRISNTNILENAFHHHANRPHTLPIKREHDITTPIKEKETRDKQAPGLLSFFKENGEPNMFGNMTIEDHEVKREPIQIETVKTDIPLNYGNNREYEKEIPAHEVKVYENGSIDLASSNISNAPSIGTTNVRNQVNSTSKSAIDERTGYGISLKSIFSGAVEEALENEDTKRVKYEKVNKNVIDHNDNTSLLAEQTESPTTNETANVTATSNKDLKETATSDSNSNDNSTSGNNALTITTSANDKKETSTSNNYSKITTTSENDAKETTISKNNAKVTTISGIDPVERFINETNSNRPVLKSNDKPTVSILRTVGSHSIDNNNNNNTWLTSNNVSLNNDVKLTNIDELVDKVLSNSIATTRYLKNNERNVSANNTKVSETSKDIRVSNFPSRATETLNYAMTLNVPTTTIIETSNDSIASNMLTKATTESLNDSSITDTTTETLIDDRLNIHNIEAEPLKDARHSTIPTKPSELLKDSTIPDTLTESLNNAKLESIGSTIAGEKVRENKSHRISSVNMFNNSTAIKKYKSEVTSIESPIVSPIASPIESPVVSPIGEDYAESEPLKSDVLRIRDPLLLGEEYHLGRGDYLSMLPGTDMSLQHRDILDDENAHSIARKEDALRSHYALRTNENKDLNKEILDLIQSYYKTGGRKHLKDIYRDSKGNDNRANRNRIEFFNAVDKESIGAVCMDGSRPGYYLRKGFDTGVDKWIIHLHGGAWCYNLQTCFKRRNTILGSTKGYSREDISKFFHGILSKSAAENPDFFKWNIAVLSYCDGGLFSGNRKMFLVGKGKKFYFRGRRVLRLLMENLRHQQTLQKAKEVILSGTSAGGLALILQGDYIRKFLPKNIKVRGLADAAFFLDQKKNGPHSNRMAHKQFKALYELHRPVLKKKCVDSYPKKDRYLCLFPQNTIHFVKLPLFIVNSLYDHWQLSYLEGINCIYDNRECRTQQRDHILNFRNRMYSTLNDVKTFKNNTGVFANSCIAHGQVILDYTWTRSKIENTSIADAFAEWYRNSENEDSEGRHFHADCKHPCNGSCPRSLAQTCVENFKAVSPNQRDRSLDLCI